jgi:release factor glutamine methyltransferase
MPTPAAPGAPTHWTTASLLTWMGDAFAKASVDSPRLIAEMLLSHILACDRIRLYTQADRPATPDERERLRALVSRALRHEPVQYLVGEAWFYGAPFLADRRALIPRPSTGTLVDAALAWAKPRDPATPLRIADIGTGTGCIPITLLRRLPHSAAIATDISPDALDLARANADRHAVAPRIEFLCGDLLDPIASRGPFDAIVSNPPYIPDHEWPDVAPNVKDHEPESALRAGPDGLRFVAPLIDRAPSLLTPRGGGGLLAIEIAACTADAVLDLARKHPLLADAAIHPDSDGLPRVLTALRQP